MKWIVFWIAFSMHNVPCETSGPFVDEYGIVHGDNVTLSIACFKTDRKNMSKIFDTLEEAQAFVDRGKKECGGFKYIQGSCDEFEIRQLVGGIE